MKKIFLRTLTCFILITGAFAPALAEHVIIISANDTHSQIDPASDGKGGVLRQLAYVDAQRKQNRYVELVHAGDAVQGTTYFSLYGGKVEYALIDSMGYDMVTLGNHEFDNGIDSLATLYNSIKHPVKLSANYDLSGTPLQGFQPFTIKAYGNKRVGYFAVNVNPKGMIADNNYNGMRYLNAEQVAHATAEYLKETMKVDYVVMISHIGYTSEAPGEPCDSVIAAHSEDIDLIIGGHSHTVIPPNSSMSLVKNDDGRPITIGQNGRSGKLLGRYDLDLETGKIIYEHVNIDKSLDPDPEQYTTLRNWLAQYRHGVDSLMNRPVGCSKIAMTAFSDAMQNWVSDAVMQIIPAISGVKGIQFAIMNKGGIRTDMPEGTITEGLINSMFPFNNRFVVLDITGADLLEALHIMALRNGDAISRELRVTYNADGTILQAKYQGKAIKPKATYRILTIDYLANGGDYMESFKRAKRVFVDDTRYGIHMLRYIEQLTKAGKCIDSTSEKRMQRK